MNKFKHLEQCANAYEEAKVVEEKARLDVHLKRNLYLAAKDSIRV